MRVRKAQFLQQIKEIILREEPKAKVYLYGSRARGTQKRHSDWDLLILLDKPKLTFDDEIKISDPLYDLEVVSGQAISPQIYSEQEWNTIYKITPYYTNVMKDGILL